MLKLFSIFLLLYSIRVEAGPAPFQVVIDPGHGGADEGVFLYQNGHKITEKDLTLKLAQQVAQNLRSKGIHVALTRTQDKDIPLPARTAYANRIGADIFISLHFNSTQHGSYRKADSIQAEGIETFILNHATDASSKRLAHLENSVLQDHHVSKARGKIHSDRNISIILKDLRLDANRSESKQLACQLQTQLVSRHPSSLPKRRNRGVKQALFHVLLGADMPSALVEAGFLTHPKDRTWALSSQGMSSMSHSIAEAVLKYRYQSTHPHVAVNTCKVF